MTILGSLLGFTSLCLTWFQSSTTGMFDLSGLETTEGMASIKGLNLPVDHSSQHGLHEEEWIPMSIAFLICMACATNGKRCQKVGKKLTALVGLIGVVVLLQACVLIFSFETHPASSNPDIAVVHELREGVYVYGSSGLILAISILCARMANRVD